MAMNLPPQKPQRRTVGIRPRNDRPWLPRFPEPRERPLRPEPFDGGSWDTYGVEPQPFEWRELADPTLIVAAVLTVIGGLAVLTFWFTA